MTSKHYELDRLTREDKIMHIGIGEVIKEVVIDRGHIDGPELHKITNTGIIIIYNLYTEKIITKLIARPGQIRRYYGKEKAPNYLIELAMIHTKEGMNYD